MLAEKQVTKVLYWHYYMMGILMFSWTLPGKCGHLNLPCGQSKVERSPLNCWGCMILPPGIHQHTKDQFLNELLKLYVELVNTGNHVKW